MLESLSSVVGLTLINTYNRDYMFIAFKYQKENEEIVNIVFMGAYHDCVYIYIYELIYAPLYPRNSIS